MSSSEGLTGINATQDILDKLIKKISTLNVELIKKRQVISKLMEEKEEHLSVLKVLQNELGVLEEVVASKDKELLEAKGECETFSERIGLLESESTERELLLSNFSEKTSALEAKLMEMEELARGDGSLIEIDSLGNGKEGEIIEDIQTRISALRDL